MMFSTVTVVFLFVILLDAADVSDWTAHCDRCKCKWSGGKKMADCKNLTLSKIPGTLSSELRDIDFSYNTLYELKAREFSAANLSDVHKLKLQHCAIIDINPTAFADLSLVIELDLSHNNIVKLPPNVFRSNLKLRVIHLEHNKLQHLEKDLFSNMSHLQHIFLNNNDLEEISSDVLGVNSTVNHINLSNNRLKFMDESFIRNAMLKSLALEENPWMCDCHLQAFRHLAIASNLVTSLTICKEPERLRGEYWNNDKIIFSCSPEIVELIVNSPSTQPEPNSNYTISCKVIGDPKPAVSWSFNGRTIDSDPRQIVQKYISSKTEPSMWNNMTIVNFNHRDRGEYKCVATNPGGSDERNITLSFRVEYGDGGIYSYNNNPRPWIIGISVGACVIILMVFILIYCCCKRSGRDNNILSKSRGISQSTEFISLDRHTNEMGKSLITEVNPVVKPPRQYSVPPSVTSGGTEVSETKKMLIDDDSIYADEESRSLDFESRCPSRPQPNYIVDYRGENHYPPDLLSFPPRTMPQVSPAGSSASTVADTSRLPAHHGPQSPLHSPHYDIYRTLPCSRSQSPFTSPHGLPVRVPRQGGYVTVPRRPRQSWSSEPPALSDIGEPLYDNLGLRTTATGSSVLSLNRIGNETPKVSTPKGNVRTVYPLSPNLTSLPCDPIAEHDSPPIATTLPRSASAHRALSPHTDMMHSNWTRSPEPVDSRRESTASLLPTPDGKTPKIPPRPPPKPKKRASTGPLFEDEGEDGTEV